MVLDFEPQLLRSKPQPHPGLIRARVTRNIIQSFLQNAIDVDRSTSIDRKRRSRFLVGYANSRLPFHHRQIPFDRLLKSGFFQHHRMQRLRKTADFIQRTLSNLANLEEVGA